MVIHVSIGMKTDDGFEKKGQVPHQWSVPKMFMNLILKEDKYRGGKRGFLEEQFLNCDSIEQHTEKTCRLMLISVVPSLRNIPWSTSAWESSETRSDIAQSSPADRQFSYWPVGLRPSLQSASPSSSAPRSASGDSAAWPATAFLRDLGGLFRKNLFCDDRASWDKRLNFLDWLNWHDLAMGRKQRQRNHMKKRMHSVTVTVYTVWRIMLGCVQCQQAALNRSVNVKAEKQQLR